MTTAEVAPTDGTVAPPATLDEVSKRARRRRPTSGATPAERRMGRLASARRRIGLRRRILLVFTLGSLGLSAFLAVTSYGLVRSNLIEQRENASRRAAYINASNVQAVLRGEPDSAQPASDRLQELGVQAPLIWYDDAWSSGRYGPEAIPRPLRNKVLDDAEPAWMITEVDDQTVMVFGIPLPELGAYFEFFEIGDDERTLSNVALSLLLASLITTALGVLLGVFAARRAVRPVAEAASAAKAITAGALDTRLPPTSDPDLGVLASSFNDMAAALQLRIERDARFASDVSHELRSPLMTLSASVEVMEARRNELPERAQAALDLLTSDVSRFQGLVEDLLEISRFDAGAIRLHIEDLPVAEFVRNAVAVSAAPDTPVNVSPRAERAVIRGDRRRLARVVANLIDNARAYGGGDPELTILDPEPAEDSLSHVQIVVEDHGPGVPVEERALIFERFARGGSAGRRAGSEGAGLGLALVDEHVRIHGGRVWVDDRHDGEPGASFVIELPATEGVVVAQPVV